MVYHWSKREGRESWETQKPENADVLVIGWRASWWFYSDLPSYWGLWTFSVSTWLASSGQSSLSSPAGLQWWRECASAAIRVIARLKIRRPEDFADFVPGLELVEPGNVFSPKAAGKIFILTPLDFGKRFQNQGDQNECYFLNTPIEKNCFTHLKNSAFIPGLRINLANEKNCDWIEDGIGRILNSIKMLIPQRAWSRA